MVSYDGQPCLLQPALSERTGMGILQRFGIGLSDASQKRRCLRRFHEASLTVRLPALLGICALLLPSCESDGHFAILGYTTRPNYDCSIHTVQVPVFKNLTFWKGIEFDLTKAVVREIESKTPYKVVSNACDADTILTGAIVS